MIGHVTKVNLEIDQGVLTDFHGRHYKFNPSTVIPHGYVHVGAEFYFDPQVSGAGMLAVNLHHQHHDDCSLRVAPLSVTGPRFVRIGELVLDLMEIQYYEMTSRQSEIRNGYASTDRHLMIQMKSGRQFNFYNWNGINIDEVLDKLVQLHTVVQQLG